MGSSPHVPLTAAVTGLRREARIVSRSGIVTVVGGGNARVVERGIGEAIANGAGRILSIGICGALSPHLKIGDCIVATEIVAGDERFPADREWSSTLLKSVPQGRAGVIAGVDAILSAPEAKSRVQRATGAVAADMESHVAARAAKRRSLPFAAVRVVSDTAEQSLPPAALVAMLENGRIDVSAVARSLMREPGQIPSLIRTAFDAERAFRALARVSRVLGL